MRKTTVILCLLSSCISLQLVDARSLRTKRQELVILPEEKSPSTDYDSNKETTWENELPEPNETQPEKYNHDVYGELDGNTNNPSKDTNRNIETPDDAEVESTLPTQEEAPDYTEDPSLYTYEDLVEFEASSNEESKKTPASNQEQTKTQGNAHISTSSLDSKQEVGHESFHDIIKVENSAIQVGFVASLCGFLLSVFTAFQMSENPDGIFASLCRCILYAFQAVTRVFCGCCRKRNDPKQMMVQYGHLSTYDPH